ncbi:type I polyketide synthase [Stigmatella aurantiaca]|uniref:Polyketide synthase n=1 Tax=Stigmatella aurantiaca (strain DW4/3-1) TaxID=378806 RepID=E3FE04_STIAD|nr:type I polyketide synthase [Stigmatella aurantiaca]ADO72607.1 Polyketide synthase [Stigmatella aurantiaca DW4/3-1]
MSNDQTPASLEAMTPLQRAALAIKTLRTRIDGLERARTEPIAIIGMGCRFPGGADNPGLYWELLRAGVDAVGKVPSDRWDADAYYAQDPGADWKMVVREGGFLAQPIAAFDCEFFGLSPREANYVDPQQRLMLEVAWESLEDAGINPDSLAGSDTGVYVGFLSSDYGRVPFNAIQTRDLPYMGTGNELSFSAGRVSYVLGLQGPSMVVATACSSALVSAHLACQALRLGECSLALAGGVNLILHPDNNIVLSKMRALAPDGRSKTFDASANGYGRGEGCGVLVLKRLSDAQRDKDRILAVIRGSAVNHDGPSGGLTVPNGPAQEKLLRKALETSGLSPSDVRYVEAHGTGTPLGDPIELRALDAVFGQGRRPDEPLLVGSAKTNLGHLESAAGAAGMIKVVQSLRHGELPPHLHFRQPTPAIDWEQLRLSIPTQVTGWPSGAKSRIAGISGFGLSGVNAHVLIEEAPPVLPRAPEEAPRPLHLLALSAKSQEALGALAQRYEQVLGGPELASEALADICFTANTGRAHFKHRLAFVGDSQGAMREQLRAFQAGHGAQPMLSGKAEGQPRIAFLFTGQGAQWLGMGEELFRTEPTFRRTLLRCDEVLRPLMGVSLISLLYPPERDDNARVRLDETGYTQPALFALEYALAQLWMQWGIVPDFVMGHSVGEFVAACVAGVFTLEEGLELIATRARLMQSLPAGGGMAAVSAASPEVEALLPKYEGQVSIAALNGPRSVVLSGREGALSDCLGELAKKGVRCTPLRVSHAFHSALMDPILDAFSRAVEKVRFQPPGIPLISNLSGKEAGAEIVSPRYWVDHLRKPVMFAQGMETLAQAGVQVFLEAGPKPTLVAMGQACVSGDDKRWLASLRPEHSDWRQMLEGLASLYVAGAQVKWRGLEEGIDRRKVSLPSYPFQRRAYWMELTGTAWDRQGTRGQGTARDERVHPLLGRRQASPAQVRQFESSLGPSKLPFLRDHGVYGQIVMPGAAYVEMGLAAGAALFGEASSTVDALAFSQALFLPEEGDRRVHLLYTPEGERSGRFEIFSQDEEAGDGGAEPSWTLHAHGKLASAASVPGERLDLQGLRAEFVQEVPVEAYYEKLGQAGLSYGPSFRAIRGLWRGQNEVLGQLGLAGAALTEAERYLLPPSLLDACFQMVGAVLDEAGETAYLPVGVGKVRVFRAGLREVWAHARISRDEDPKGPVYTCDIKLLSSEGALVASVEQLLLRRVTREGLFGARSKRLQNWLYELEWQVRPLAAQSGTPGDGTSGTTSGAAPQCLILADETGVGHRLAERLQASGWNTVTVGAGEEGSGVDRARAEALLALLESAVPCPIHVIDLWSLGGATAGPDVSRDALRHSTRVLELAQALVRGSKGRTASLWLVTRGAQAVTEGEPLAGLSGSALWGLGKAITREHPELHCRRVDLDPGSSPYELEQLAGEILGESSEDEIALRGDTRRVARLARSHRLRSPGGETSASLRPDATYVVTGGLGGLGLAVAERLAEKGARHLVLIGRSEPGAEARSRLAALTARGVEVQSLQCDVSVSSDLERAMSEIGGRLPPIRGVVHSAAVIDDGLLIQMTPERFARVFAAKVFGGWNLHHVLQGVELDFFVLFSSASSLIGSSGQANYVAANAFLDGLAHLRRSAGLPGLSLNWGAWAEIGVAAEAQLQRRMEQLGFGVIPPADGLQLFEQALGLGGQLGILPVDWAMLGRRGSSPLFEAFIEKAAPAESGGIRRKLEPLSAEGQRAALRAHVGELVNGVLGRPPAEALDPNQGFFALGMDSLMSVELRNVLQRSLGASLPATVAFDNPNVNELVNYLAAEVLGLKDDEAAPAAAWDAGEDQELDALLADVDDLDDDQVQAMLRRGR